jgi:hypothetical protein
MSGGDCRPAMGCVSSTTLRLHAADHNVAVESSGVNLWSDVISLCDVERITAFHSMFFEIALSQPFEMRIIFLCLFVRDAAMFLPGSEKFHFSPLLSYSAYIST